MAGGHVKGDITYVLFSTNNIYTWCSGLADYIMRIICLDEPKRSVSCYVAKAASMPLADISAASRE
jgi:hypothetical protein